MRYKKSFNYCSGCTIGAKLVAIMLISEGHPNQYDNLIRGLVTLNVLFGFHHFNGECSLLKNVNLDIFWKIIVVLIYTCNYQCVL